MVAGRSTEARSVASVGTTSGSAALTGPAGSFDKGDVGRTITGTGVPGGATVTAVASSTAATMSANATATGTVTVALGSAVTTGAYGFVGWSPETDTEAQTYTVAAVNAGQIPPDRLQNAYTPYIRRARG